MHMHMSTIYVGLQKVFVTAVVVTVVAATPWQ